MELIMRTKSTRILKFQFIPRLNSPNPCVNSSILHRLVTMAFFHNSRSKTRSNRARSFCTVAVIVCVATTTKLLNESETAATISNNIIHYGVVMKTTPSAGNVTSDYDYDYDHDYFFSIKHRRRKPIRYVGMGYPDL